MKKISLYILLALIVYSCRSNDQGELVGVKSKSKWQSEKPLGMTLIPGGSFTMGKQSEDIAGSLNSPTRTVTVRPFYMDETEITNSEYKEFVFWVRDSIVRTELALYAELLGEEGLEDYKFLNVEETDMTPYQQYMMEAYGSIDGDPNSPTQGKMLNWEEEIIWDKNQFPSIQYAEVMVDSIFIPIEDSFEGRRMVNVDKLKFKYYYLDQEAAAKNEGQRRDFIKQETVRVYPDTTVWVRDFNYSYNDPMHQDYFYHEAYNDYPVVGISWIQAKAFCRWRTKKKNDFLNTKRKSTTVPQFRLASEAEWEYAARGGLENATYPWGGP
ncbi:gliding motility lipoprotein GldK, partial [Lutibacter sp.]